MICLVYYIFIRYTFYMNTVCVLSICMYAYYMYTVYCIYRYRICILYVYVFVYVFCVPLGILYMHSVCRLLYIACTQCRIKVYIDLYTPGIRAYTRCMYFYICGISWYNIFSTLNIIWKYVVWKLYYIYLFLFSHLFILNCLIACSLRVILRFSSFVCLALNFNYYSYPFLVK